MIAAVTHKGERRSQVPSVKDVVCGMDIDSTTAAAQSEHKGKTYYFCAPGCKKEFDRDPEKFVG